MKWPTPAEAVRMLGLSISPEEFVALFAPEGRVVVSFSGGRTSALMLWCMIVAFGGELPERVVVVFANTGKEREETLRFVHEVGRQWGVRIRWVEYRPKPVWFEEVGFNSASRAGEPLVAKFEVDGRLANPMDRTCSGETKRRTIRRFAKAELGWQVFLTAVGLRFDEGPRVLKQERENERSRSKKTSPLAYAGIVKRQVRAFWLGANVDPQALRFPLPQGFDLGLREDEGNCDLCFLKGYAKLVRLIREAPERADWWIAQEAAHGKQFERQWSYTDLKRAAVQGRELPFDETPDEDGECGDACYTRSSAMERAAEQAEFERVVAERRAA